MELFGPACAKLHLKHPPQRLPFANDHCFGWITLSHPKWLMKLLVSLFPGVGYNTGLHGHEGIRASKAFPADAVTRLYFYGVRFTTRGLENPKRIESCSVSRNPDTEGTGAFHLLRSHQRRVNLHLTKSKI